MARALSESVSMFARAGRGRPPSFDAAQLRAPLVWLHSDTLRGAQSLVALSEILLREEASPSVLLTHPEGLSKLPDLQGRAALVLAADDARFARALAAHVQPAAFLSGGRHIPTGMIAALASGGTRILLAEMEVPRLATGWRSLPGLLRRVLRQVDHVLLPNARARVEWSGYGLSEDALLSTGRLTVIQPALGCNEAERDMLSDAFRHRTMWFAAHVPEREEDLVIAAHREALRESPRLALILNPADPRRGAALKAALAPRFSTALRSEDDPVTPETQIYIVDTEDERGLWYRLGVACYIGGTMGGEGALVNPMEAAGLGCAIVHGRMFGRFAEAFDLLRQSRATRMVQGPEALGPAIGGALRPEQAADMANRGWQVIADGAEATEQVVGLLLAACAARGAG